MTTVTARQLVDLMTTQSGKRYRFGSEGNVTNFYAKKDWDCSELPQVAGDVLGVTPAIPDGAFNQWKAAKRITVADGIKTLGAFLFIGDGKGTGRSAITHIAVSRGDGHTIEARSTKYGVGIFSAAGRFNFAGLMPGITYGRVGAPPTPSPTQLPSRPSIRLGDTGRAAEILNWELTAVTGQQMTGDCCTIG